jgi:hypothetical protein
VLFNWLAYPARMAKKTVRVSLDLPVELHCRLREVAERQRSSVRQLMLHSIELAVEDSAAQRPRRRLCLDPAIVPSTGKPFDFTNAEIYELAGFE